MKILIAVPTFETIYPDTFQSIYELDTEGHEVFFRFVRGYDCATARNNIAQMALNMGVDYVLMVDNDVVLPKETIKWMLDEPVDVCLGYYAHRGADNLYTGRVSVCKLGWYNYPLESEYTADEMETYKKHGEKKMKIHGGGMGCAMINTDVFRRTTYPWYDWVNYADDNRGMLSEDLFFCEKCRLSFIDIHTDARVGCGHMLRHIQWPV